MDLSRLISARLRANSSRAASITSRVFSARAVMSSEDDVIPIVGIGARTVVHSSVVVRTLERRRAGRKDRNGRRTLNDEITSVERSILRRVRSRVVLADDGDDGKLRRNSEMESAFFERK